MQHCFRKFLALLVLVVFCGSASAGDILVYKLTSRPRGSLGNSNVTAPLVRCYLVIDFETGEARGVSYSVQGGKKQRKFNSPFNVTRAPLPNAKSATVIAYGWRSDASVNDFHTTSVVIRGTDVSVKVETEPALRTVERPRILTGMGIGASSNNGIDGEFRFVSYNFVLHSALTIDANNNDKSVTAVVDQISATLTEQGYQLPPPEE